MAKRPNPEIVSYIENHLSKGFDIKNIKKKLAEVGHPIDAIEDAAQFVLAKQPKKPVPRFVIVYGIILLVVIAGFAYYAWFKATQQIEYKETVQEIQKNQSYAGMTDVQLLKLAASDDDMKACGFVKDHNEYYACIGKYWLKNDCSWEIVLGEGIGECYLRKAKSENTTKWCYFVPDKTQRFDCIYLIEEGRTYQEHLNYVNQSAIIDEKKNVKERITGFENDFGSCYEANPNGYCIFLSLKNGEFEKLKNAYTQKKGEDVTWQAWSTVYDVLKTVKSGGDCSAVTYDRAKVPDYFMKFPANIQYIKEICVAISSHNSASCLELENQLFSSACYFFTKENAEACGEEYDCVFFVRVFESM